MLGDLEAERMRRHDCRLPELAWVSRDGWLPPPGLGVGDWSRDGTAAAFGIGVSSFEAAEMKGRVGRVHVLRCGGRAVG